MKVILASPLPVAAEVLKKACGNIDIRTVSPSAITGPLETDVLITTTPTQPLLDATKCRLLCIPYAGIDKHFPVLRAAAQARPDLQITNMHSNAPLVAQHAMAMLLSLTNQIIPYDRSLRRGEWRPNDPLPGHVSSAVDGQWLGPSTILGNDMTVGLLGSGAIGAALAPMLAGFGVRVVHYTQHPDPSDPAQFGPDTLDKFMDAADAVISTLPKTPATCRLITAEHLARLGPAGLVVIVGRAAPFVEDDLYSALVSRTIRGAALDVWWSEPDASAANHDDVRPFTRPWNTLGNVVLSPHRGWLPFRESMGQEWYWKPLADNVRRLEQGLPLNNVVSLDDGY